MKTRARGAAVTRRASRNAAIRTIAAIVISAAPAGAQGPILTCPVAQTPVANGARPDPKLLERIVRCRKGEKPAEPGYDGAVTIEVAALQIGAPRTWDSRRDIGSGARATVVYPVRVTYTERTWYRTRTVVSANWIRVMNFYVDAFGEWTSGSEEPVKAPENRSIPVGQ